MKIRRNRTDKTVPAGKAAGKAPSNRPVATDIGDDVDHAKVERISQAIADGSFRVDSSAVADRMISAATDLLAKHK